MNLESYPVKAQVLVELDFEVLSNRPITTFDLKVDEPLEFAKRMRVSW